MSVINLVIKTVPNSTQMTLCNRLCLFPDTSLTIKLIFSIIFEVDTKESARWGNNVLSKVFKEKWPTVFLEPEKQVGCKVEKRP